jgi:predicted nucleic acid-binding protein
MRSDFDLLIAAAAIRHNLILVTGNAQHFEGIPNLRLEDWFGESK